jgi:hypothetical protein
VKNTFWSIETNFERSFMPRIGRIAKKQNRSKKLQKHNNGIAIRGSDTLKGDRG